MYDLNLPRWVKISVVKHFKEVAAEISLPVQAIGVDDPDSQLFKDAPLRAELRLQGPSIREFDKGIYMCFVDINVLFTERIGEESQNVYTATNAVGAIQVAASRPILVKRYGPGTQDDESTVGCLSLVSGKDNPVNLYDFGQVTDQDRVRQLMIDARYYIETTSRGAV